MKKCDICGRESNRISHLQGYSLCSKHMHQLFSYGKFLDNIQRTNSDLNDYIIQGDIVIFNLYNQKNEKNGEFIIDFEDIEKVKYHKWRISWNHVVTGLPAKGTQRDLAHVVLDVKPNGIHDFVVDHINGNAFDNRKSNLRICSQNKNTLNKRGMSNNTSGFIGISYRKDRNRYDPEIGMNRKRWHLGYTKTLEEAVYKRYYAEKLLFKEFANKEEQKKKEKFTKNLPLELKQQLEKMVEKKLSRQ